MRKIVAITALLVAASVPATTLAGSNNAGSLSSSGVAATEKGVMTGKSVILRIGPGFNPFTADSIARVLEKNGCPATVTTERGLPKHIGVEIDGKVSRFTEAGSAGAAALRRCKG